MLRPTLIAALTLGATAGTLAYARGDAEPSRPIEDIEWSYRPASAQVTNPLLRLTRDGMNSMFDPSDLPEIMTALAAVPDGAGAETAFRLVREAGTLACTGRATGGGRASGTCRFDPDGRFVAGLAARGLTPEDNEDMLALAIVDARLATVDGLAGEGFQLEDADQLTAVSALEVTPAFADELRGVGLVAEEVDDLIAAKSLEIDAAWVREMAEAGYPNLSFETAIKFRALDVTPDYARRMARVMRETEAAE